MYDFLKVMIGSFLDLIAPTRCNSCKGRILPWQKSSKIYIGPTVMGGGRGSGVVISKVRAACTVPEHDHCPKSNKQSA
jgi:hypothetical protein